MRLVLLLMLLSSLHLSAQTLPLADRRDDFKTFVQDFIDNYAYLDRNEKPWTTWQARYSEQVDQASSPEQYAGVFETALDELHDFHAEVRSRNPHRWLPVPTFQDIYAELSGDFALVIAVRHGSDAERSGILPGDRITTIGATPVPRAIAARLTPVVDTTKPASRQWALLSMLAGRADEERSFTFVDKQGKHHLITLQLERQFDRPSGLLSATILPGNIGLIRFHNSLGDQKTVSAFDAALQTLRSTKSLILDLRDVPSGGNSSVALGIMGRFVQTMLPYQRHRIPNYGQSDVERNWIEEVAPRGPSTYTAPVAILVDHWTGSMGEGMAAGFDAMHRASVIGTPMAHLAGAVSEYTLPKTGVVVAFPTEQLFHINGTPRQLWKPPTLMQDAGNSVGDPVLTRAITLLKDHP